MQPRKQQNIFGAVYKNTKLHPWLIEQFICFRIFAYWKFTNSICILIQQSKTLILENKKRKYIHSVKNFGNKKSSLIMTGVFSPIFIDGQSKTSWLEYW